MPEDKSINNLPETTTLADTDVIPVVADAVSSAVTKKIQKQNLRTTLDIPGEHVLGGADHTGNLTQARSHDSVDTDTLATSLHHTLGTTATQACAGNDARLSDSRAPSGAAGGDLSGTYPNPSVQDDSHNHTTSTLPATMPPSAHDILSTSHGDTLADTLVAGDVLVVNATPKLSRLAANATATAKFLKSISSAVADWVQVAFADLSGKLTAGMVDSTGVTDGYVLTADGADGAGWEAPTGGLADPGSNGIVKRTALNTTDVAAASDVTGLFTGAGDYLKADGTTGTPAGTLLGLLSWYDAKVDGGLAGDGTTDDTSALQDLIDTATASGTQSCTIYFPPGVYLIEGALQDTGAFNGQILLPSVALNAAPITVSWVGESAPPNAGQTAGTALDPADGYSIIKSTLTGASGTAAMLSGGQHTITPANANNVNVVIRNLIFESPANPTFTMLNLSNCQGSELDGVFVYTGDYNGSVATQPTNSNAYGIKVPQWNNTNYTRLKNVLSANFYTGILDGELSHWDGVRAGNCIYAFERPFANFQSVWVNVGYAACTYGVKVSGANILLCESLWIEHTSTPAWQVTVNDLVDASNEMQGYICWFSFLAGSGPDHSFDKSGGTGLYEWEAIKLLPDSGVTADTYGDATNVAQITVDDYGRVTAASEVAISASAGVASLAKSGGTQLTGDVTLSEGTGITLTPSGNDIEIAATGDATADPVINQTGNGSIQIPGLAACVDVTGVGGGGISEEYDSATTGLTWDVAPATEDSDTTVKSHLYLKKTAASTSLGVRAWTPGAGAFDARTKVNIGTDNLGAPSGEIGLYIQNSDASVRAIVRFGIAPVSTALKCFVDAFTYASSTWTQRGSTWGLYTPGPMYLRMTRDGSNNLSFYFSGDGIVWTLVATQSLTLTVSHVGYYLNHDAGGTPVAIYAVSDWLRTDV